MLLPASSGLVTSPQLDYPSGEYPVPGLVGGQSILPVPITVALAALMVSWGGVQGSGIGTPSTLTSPLTVSSPTYVAHEGRRRLRRSAEQPPVLSVAERIDAVRQALALSMTQVAEILGVSRPTLYSWRDGSVVPKEIHMQRLRELGAIAEESIMLGIGRMRQLVTTPLPVEGSLLSLLQAPHLDRPKINAALLTLSEMEKRSVNRQRRMKYKSVAQAMEEHGFASRDLSDGEMMLEEHRLTSDPRMHGTSK